MNRTLENRWCFTLIIYLLGVDCVPAATLYVSPDSTNATPPYTSWSTAATTIQPAVDAASDGDEVLVTNGLYATGGQMASGFLTNRLVVTNNVTVRSVNGPEVTVVQGFQAPSTINGSNAVRCVFLSAGTLSGFTLTNGAVRIYSDFVNYTTDQNCGGGVYCASTNAVVTNCVIADSSSYWEGGGAYGATLYNCILTGNFAGNDHGGGAGQCTLYNCILSNNYAGWNGGGAWRCTLYNCLVTSNSGWCGGAYGSTLYNCTVTGNSGYAIYGDHLYNCIVYFNYFHLSSPIDNYGYSTLDNCCMTPILPTGVGNITNQPLFIDYTNGNFRLQSNSPCINAGNNAYVTTTTDLDGNPRIVSGTVDIGAYEYQGSGSVISYAWLQQYGLPTDGSADFIDSDYDGMNNWQEWVCGTCPTNAQSVLKLLSAEPVGTNVTVSWESVSGINYFLERTLTLNSPFEVLATNITGQPGVTSYADTNAVGTGSFYYRVGVSHGN